MPFNGRITVYNYRNLFVEDLRAKLKLNTEFEKVVFTAYFKLQNVDFFATCCLTFQTKQSIFKAKGPHD